MSEHLAQADVFFSPFIGRVINEALLDEMRAVAARTMPPDHFVFLGPDHQPIIRIGKSEYRLTAGSVRPQRRATGALS